MIPQGAALLRLGRAIALATLCVSSLCLTAPVDAQEENSPKPPFITTPVNVAERMLALAGTRADDIVVDLGSGDGRIVINAATQFGARGIGLELDPALVEKSLANARSAGVADRTEFRVADVLRADFRNATVVTAYLLPWLLDKLGTTLLYDLRPGTRIVTHAFVLAGWQPDRSETVIVTAPDPKAGAATTIHLWTVPAKVRGDWRAEFEESATAGKSMPGSLTIRQSFQELDIAGSTAEGARLTGSGRVDGLRVTFSAGTATRKWTFSGRSDGELLRGTLAADESAALRVTLRRR